MLMGRFGAGSVTPGCSEAVGSARERQQSSLSWAVTSSRGWAMPALPHPHFLNSDLFVKSCLQLVPALSAEQKAVLKAKEPIKSMHRGKSNTMKKT